MAEKLLQKILQSAIQALMHARRASGERHIAVTQRRPQDAQRCGIRTLDGRDRQTVIATT